MNDKYPELGGQNETRPATTNSDTKVDYIDNFP